MNSRYFIIITVCWILAYAIPSHADNTALTSPNGKLKINLTTGEDLIWSVSYNNQLVIAPGAISLTIDGKELGAKPVLLSSKQKQVDQQVKADVPRKSKILRDYYNELTLEFKGGYSLLVRAYDNGVAYRFVTRFKNDVTVNTEQLNLNFEEGTNVFFPEESSMVSHYERFYQDTSLSAIQTGKFCSLPLLATTAKGIRVLITDADLLDYPNMFLSVTGQNALKSKFPPMVLETQPGKSRDRDEKVVKEANYIAKTKGTRSFPWRTFVITDDDRQLIENDLVFKLSSPSVVQDASWIKPGKVAWDWYNANNIYGVDFRAGLNTETYKYYIDFASKNNLEYIILDEGWSASTTDLTTGNPDLNVQELISYGKSKNVGIILWMLWKPLQKDMESLLDKFAQWGVKGIKVDFMQRADQDMVNYYEKVARACANRKLLVDFHGSYKPTGLHRTYPNVLTFEGVKGLENNKWSDLITPKHNVTLPFIRMVAGPMDYTPGSMINANQKSFRDIFDAPMSMGTRCHQLAMYMVYESPLQMLADLPTNYYREQECTNFISKIPVVWDETKVLEAKVSEYVLLARKHDSSWYMGAMTNWEARTLRVDLSFLDDGNYQIEIMQDGINADRNGNDYKKIVQTVNKNSKLNISLAPGGGWAAIIRQIK